MTTTNIRSIAPTVVSHQGNRHRDDLDTRDAGSGALTGIAFGGPLGSLIGLVALTLAVPALGPGAMLAGMIIGLVAGIVLGAFGGLYRRVRSYEDADFRATHAATTARSFQHFSAD